MIASSLLSLALAGAAVAAPTISTKRAPDCNAPVKGLEYDDCVHMSNIGMAGMGVNDDFNNGGIWVGSDGPNTLTFTNLASTEVPITLIMWDNPPGDYESSFMNVREPKVSYSLPYTNATVTISIENGISGGWATLNERLTTLSPYGQIYNTWGEFTTGPYATVDVSRLVNTGGNVQSIQVESGCLTDMETCVFKCKDSSLSSCGASGEYDLVNCDPATNPNAAYGTYDGVNPEGGCMGWSDGGHLDIALGNF